MITGALDRQIRDSYNAYVVFTEPSSVAQAVATNGALFEGRYLRIDRVTGAAAGSKCPGSQRPTHPTPQPHPTALDAHPHVQGCPLVPRGRAAPRGCRREAAAAP